MKLFIGITLLIISLLSFFSTLNSNILFAECNNNGSLIQSVQYITEKTIPGDIILSNFWPYFGYYGNLQVHSLYSSDIHQLIQKYSPKYIIHGTRIGTEFDNTILNDSKDITSVNIIKDTCDVVVTVYKVNDTI